MNTDVYVESGCTLMFTWNLVEHWCLRGIWSNTDVYVEYDWTLMLTWNLVEHCCLRGIWLNTDVYVESGCTLIFTWSVIVFTQTWPIFFKFELTLILFRHDIYTKCIQFVYRLTFAADQKYRNDVSSGRYLSHFRE